MKIKKGFVVREIAGKSVVIALGAASVSFNGMIELNGMARVFWDMLAEGMSEDDMVKAILEEYDADEVAVRADVDNFVSSLSEAGILE